LASYRAAQLATWLRTLAQALMLLGGIATLGAGTLMVLAGDMTVGALVASMALVWRILSPLQLAFLSFTRLEQVGQGLRQINTLMRQKVEREPGAIVERLRTFQGRIRFERVSLRYNPRSEPALLAVNAEINPGEIVAITGPNGSGKSTLMKLIAGLYEPQFGGVFIDGMDTRQLDIDELRGAIAYVPQACDLFHGTIAQNLRLANPTASERDLAQAALDAGLLEEILAFPEGFDTRLTDQLQRQLPGGVKQRLMLARAYVKAAPVVLMDEPANGLDREGDEQLMRKLQSLRGRSTVLLVTHRPSHMRLADKIFYLEGGRLMLAGPPGRVLPQLGMG
jgi:ATP-binding cassette subfamily C protein/ATP-binding cassette subfamily C protein LapB